MIGRFILITFTAFMMITGCERSDLYTEAENAQNINGTEKNSPDENTGPGAALSGAKAITAFSFPGPGITATIDETAKTITAAAAFGTDVDSMTVQFTSTGRYVRVG